MLVFRGAWNQKVVLASWVSSDFWGVKSYWYRCFFSTPASRKKKKKAPMVQPNPQKDPHPFLTSPHPYHVSSSSNPCTPSTTVLPKQSTKKKITEKLLSNVQQRIHSQNPTHFRGRPQPAATFHTPFKPSWYRLGKVTAVGSKVLKVQEPGRMSGWKGLLGLIC